MDEEKQLVGGTYRLVDIADAGGIIQNLTAEGVTFLGPAVVVMDGGLTLGGHDIGAPGGLDSILWEIDPSRPTVAGGIGFKNSRLTNCKFRGVGFAGMPDTIATLLNSLRV